MKKLTNTVQSRSVPEVINLKYLNMFPVFKSSSDLLYDWKYKITVQMLFCWSLNASGKAIEGSIEVEIRPVVVVIF